VPALLATFLLALVSCLGACGGGSSTSSGLSGTYEASQGTEAIVLVFKSGNAVEMTMDSGGKKETMNATYTIEGDKVTITSDKPDSIPMVLTRNGEVLVGPMGTFKKK
jgi:hypothetical protein